ncbi:ABC transporter substrate-binding protein [Acidovorax sp. GBBC 3334]|uniref:ABC transporter substrate-binding protein n=1 Tax=Acidovorax sp. GBBC 3334 TaxID=2940496 RepID=UPI00230471AE|nr:ABC transporter substrate-binding protein [Acidovorax sp. GBBC 3334]MDA8455367.1 ABC transporter substrate-binding protein [Acidovorax sp. GBBC 3334]
MPRGGTSIARRRLRAWRGALLAAGALAAFVPGQAGAGPVLDRVKSRGEMLVCIWPGYHGVSYRHPRTRELSGIDIELSRQFAQDLGVRIEYVDSTFASVAHDLLVRRCDVAMFAVGMMQPRMQEVRFSQPYLRSDMYAITTKINPVVQQWSDIDRPGVAVAVQSGTLMQAVLLDRLKNATVVPVQPPASRERELISGRVDVFMTNYAYARRLMESADWARLIQPPTPFFVIPAAYAVRPGDADWLAAVDAFVARIKGDGRLQAAAQRHGLGPLVVP